MAGAITIGPNKFPQVTRALLSDLDRLANAIAIQLEYNGHVEVPVDTGNLSGTIYWIRIARFHYEVRADAEYAAAVHEGSDHGTYTIASNPFFTRAINTEKPHAGRAAGVLAAKYGGYAS